MSSGFAVRLVLALALARSVQSVGWWEGIPVAGHIAGIVAYCKNEKEAGDRCMKSASRSVAVIGGAVVGGPAGATAAGTAYDGLVYGIEKCIDPNARPGGTLGAICETMSSSGESSLSSRMANLAINLGGDALSGVGGGCSSAVSKTVSNAVTTSLKQGVSKTVVHEATKTVTKIVAKSAVANSGACLVSTCTKYVVETAVAAAADSGSEASTSTSASTSAPTSTSTSTSTQTGARNNVATEGVQVGEEEPEEERRSVNVYRCNYTLILQRLPADRANLLVWQLKLSIKRLVSIQHIFLNFKKNLDISPDPRNGGPTHFVKPLEQTTAECSLTYACDRVRIRGGHPIVLAKFRTKEVPGGTDFSGAVYCTMVSKSGWMCEGMSPAACKRMMGLAEDRRDGPANVGPEGVLVNPHIESRLTAHPPVAPGPSFNPKRDKCAEHHAWYNLRTASGEDCISTMSFRIDAAGRVVSAPRCDNCVEYDLGFALTDTIPQNTWLNAPSLLDVYV